MAKPEEYSVQEATLVNGQLDMKIAGTFTVTQEPQVLNIGDFCNECGNCTTFCPTAGDPYKDKPRIHLSDQGFVEADSGYQLKGATLRFKNHDYQSSLSLKNGDYLYHSPVAQVLFDRQSKRAESIKLEAEADIINTQEALEMIVLYENLKDNPIFN